MCVFVCGSNRRGGAVSGTRRKGYLEKGKEGPRETTSARSDNGKSGADNGLCGDRITFLLSAVCEAR